MSQESHTTSQSSAETQVTAEGGGCFVECQVNVLRIHQEPNTTSPTLREIARGDQLSADCSPTTGGRYVAACD